MSKAPKKRGLSIEEKVERIEEWFISHPTPYTLKDLLLAIPKSTGVIPQSVEECLELLVSEDRVCQKKVGQHVLFWRFPKTAAQQITATFNRSGGGASVMLKYMNTTLPQIQSELKALAAKEKETRQRIQDAHAGIGDDASVHNDVMRTRELQDDVKRLQLELERLSVFDTLTIEKVKSATNIAWEAANRWTDNMYLLEHYILQRMGITTQELRARLQLPAEIDYIEFDELSIDKNAESKMVTVMPNRILSPPTAEANVHEADEMKTSPLLPAAEAACAETRAAEEEEAAAQCRGRKKTPATVDTAKRGREDRGDNKNNNDDHAEKRGEKESLCGELVEDTAQPPLRRRYRKKKDV